MLVVLAPNMSHHGLTMYSLCCLDSVMMKFGHYVKLKSYSYYYLINIVNDFKPLLQSEICCNMQKFILGYKDL